MSWRNENKLKQDNQSYKSRYKEVEGNVLCKRKKKEPFFGHGVSDEKKIMQDFQL